jgi:hypothetical protein
MYTRILSIVLPALIVLALSAPAPADVLYSNGAINGTVNAIPINLGGDIADSFTLSSDATLTGVTLGLWAYYGDSPATVDWLIWSDPGPAEGGTLLDSAKDASLSNTFLLNNHNLVNGFNVYQSSFALPSIALGPGTYWLELTNANDSMSDFIDWDANGGPSGAQSLYMGGPPLFGNLTLANNCGDSNLTPGFGGATLASCSESFEIKGQSTPEPAQLALVLNAGLLLVVAALRRKLDH